MPVKEEGSSQYDRRGGWSSEREEEIKIRTVSALSVLLVLVFVLVTLHNSEGA
jgi:hypothetical protein